MGLTYQGLDFLKKNTVLENSIMCEFGDQNLYSVGGETEGSFAKPMFLGKYKVSEHVSIDLNGEGGALPYDLNEMLPVDLKGKFGIVTNFGTLEHVKSLYYGFLNMDRVCKEGGIMVHVLPLIDNWPMHGYHFFSEEFFNNLAKVCNYKLLDMFVDKPNFGGEDSYQVFCALQKTEKSIFPSFLQYDILNVGVVNV